MTPLQALLIVGGVTTVVTLLATPLCRRLALRTGVIVAPDERRVHARPTPLLGGIGMGIGLLAGLITAAQLAPLAEIFNNNTAPIGVVVAAMLMLLVGTVDDVREVSPPAKTAGTVLCASVLVFAGVGLVYFRVPLLGVVNLDPTWSYLLSVLWVYGMTTATNLIDGLDGLAAGIMGIAGGAFFIYVMGLRTDGTLSTGSIAPVLAIIIVGLCAGYLPYNLHPARIFMGDGGALLLGLLMAAATMLVGGQTGEATRPGQTFFFFAPLFIPLVILGVPILDTALSIVRRVANHTGATTADKDHIHHRLIRLGHGQRRAVGILWGWTILLSALVLWRRQVVFIGLAAIGLIIYSLLPRWRPARPEPAAAPPPPPPPPPPPAPAPAIDPVPWAAPVAAPAAGRELFAAPREGVVPGPPAHGHLRPPPRPAPPRPNRPPGPPRPPRPR